MPTNEQDSQTKKQATDDLLAADTVNRDLETAAASGGRRWVEPPATTAARRGGRGPATASTAEKIGRSYGMLDQMTVTARGEGHATLGTNLPNNSTTVDVVLNSGQGANLPTKPGLEFVIGTERFICPAGKSGDTLPQCLRAQHGSSAAAHTAGAVVRLTYATPRQVATAAGETAP